MGTKVSTPDRHGYGPEVVKVAYKTSIKYSSAPMGMGMTWTSVGLASWEKPVFMSGDLYQHVRSDDLVMYLQNQYI